MGPIRVGLTEWTHGLRLERWGKESLDESGTALQAPRRLGEGQAQRPGRPVDLREPERLGLGSQTGRPRAGHGQNGRADELSPVQGALSWPRPSALTMTRKTSVLSMKPRTASAPGP